MMEYKVDCRVQSSALSSVQSCLASSSPVPGPTGLVTPKLTRRSQQCFSHGIMMGAPKSLLPECVGCASLLTLHKPMIMWANMFNGAPEIRTADAPTKTATTSIARSRNMYGME